MPLRRFNLAAFAACALPALVTAQGVPVIDGSRLANAISRVEEHARDALKQVEKLDNRARLSEIEEEQEAAYARFLENTTGTTDVSGFETGSGVEFPSAAETYPVDEVHPDQERLFGENASVEKMIIVTARRYQNHPGVLKAGLTPTTWRILFQSLIKQESRFNNGAVSSAGAMGFCQLMPDTARGLGVNPHDPWENLDGGARYIADQLNAFGRIDYALGAYNAGPGRIHKYNGLPPFKETQTYVRRIQGYYNEYLSVITGADYEGSLVGAEGASAAWGNWADASIGYGAYQGGQIDMAMRRILGLLQQAKPASAKASVDHNTYMLAERARLMALTLRLRAAHVKVLAARNMTEAADQLEQTTFWEMRDAL